MDVQKVSQISPESESTSVQSASRREIHKDILFTAKGGSLSFAGRLFEYFVRFIFSIIVARALGAEQYGLYTLGLTVALIAVNMAMLGLQTGMVRFLPAAIREQDEAGIWGILQVGCGLPALVSLSLAAGLFLLADPLATWAFHDARLIPVFQLVSLIIPLDTLASLAYVVTISYKRPQYSVLVNNMIMPLVRLLLTVGILAIGLSTLGVIAAQIIAAVVGLALFVYFVNLLFSLKRPLQAARRDTRKLLRYSLPVYLGWMINTVRGSLETLVLGVLGLTAGIGVFAIAGRFSSIGSMFYLSIGNISTPVLSDLYSRSEMAQLRAYYQTTTRWLVTFNLPFFIMIILFAEPLLSIFGDEFTAGAMGLVILAVGTLVYTSTGLGANTLDMTDHAKVNTANAVFMVIITLGLDILLIPRWGVIGAALAASLSTVMVNILCLFEVWFLLHMQPYNRSFLKPIIAGLVTLSVTYLLIQRLSLSPLLQLFIGLAVLWSIYALVLIGLKLPVEERLVFQALRARLRLSNPFSARISR